MSRNDCVDIGARNAYIDGETREGPVASITIRNLDDATKAELRVRAARNGRSMEEEVRVILRQALAWPPEGPPGFAEAPPALIRTKSLGEMIHERFAEAGGLDLELQRREPLPPPVEFDE